MNPDAITLHDCSPPADDIVAAALHGLRQSPKTLPSKLLYDQRGSELFDAICELPEYYLTRTESGIMRRQAAEMAACVGDEALLIELGAGSSAKTRILLDRLPKLAAYVPVDISRDHLLQSARALARDYPHLAVTPVCADYLHDLCVPEHDHAARRVVYFPGSTIGNFPPDDAQRFLDRIAKLVGAGGGLLIGVDLRKSPDVLLPAYNDAQGVTAAFNLNVLRRLNHEAGANFDLDAFTHRAIWNDVEGRIEMHLVAQRAQRATFAGETFTFEPGESIHTESSYKHTPARFAELARAFTAERAWSDGDGLFSVQYLRAAGPVT